MEESTSTAAARPARPYAGPQLPDVATLKASYPVFRLDVPLFRGELDPHQHVAVACAHVAPGRRFLNMDKVGLGKTVETLGLISYQRGLGVRARWIIVVESSQLYQWADAVERFLGFAATVVRGPREKREKAYARAREPSAEFVLLITYGLIRRDFDHLWAVPGRSMAYDEAVLLANKNDTSDKCTQLNIAASYVVLMSGEPLTRGDPNQIFRLYEVMGVPLGGMDAVQFDATFCVHRPQVTWVKGRFGAYQKDLNPVVAMKNGDLLRELMAPNCIRRGDSVLPGGAFRINRQLRTVELTDAQAEAYQHLREGTLEKLRNGEMSTAEKLQTADILIQLLIAPWVWDETRDLKSPKIKLALDMLAGELEGEQAVIFVRHLRSALLVSKYLETSGISHGVYTGEWADPEERHNLVANFASGNLRVLVMSYAGHRGVDGLQCCRNLLVLDVLHQPSTVIQILGRIARRGQKSRVVNTFFFLAEGTMETRVMKKLHDRQTVADRIFSEDRAQLFDRSVEELALELL